MVMSWLLRDRKLRSTQFVPSNFSNGQVARLETRAMAAPALWFNPNPFSGMQVTAGGLFDALGQTDQPGQTAFSAVGGSVTVAWTSTASGGAFFNPWTGTLSPPTTTFTMLGSSMSQINDLANPGNGTGFGNIGNYSVSMNTYQSIIWSTSGPIDGIGNGLGLTASGARDYILADDIRLAIVNDTSFFLKETYTVHFDPPSLLSPGVGAAEAAGINTGPALDANGVPVGSLAVNAAGVLGPLTSVVNGVAIPLDPNTGSFSGFLPSPQGVTSTYVSASGTDLRVVQTTNVGFIPGTLTFGPVVGPRWFVAYGAALAVNGNSSANSGGITDLTSHYDITFTNVGIAGP